MTVLDTAYLAERTDALLTRVDQLLLGQVLVSQFTYDATTADADPGAGKFRLNHATIASATRVRFDNADASGASVAAWLDTFDDSTSTVRGFLILRGVVTPDAFAIFAVSGSVVDKTGYREVTVTHVSSGGTWTDGEGFAPVFARSGDKGDTGAGYAATSTTSLSLAASGSKAFTTQAGLAYVVGSRVRAASAANPTTKFMEGVVSSYSSTTLTIEADYCVGSGSVSDWNISVTGEGAPGAAAAAASATAAAASATTAAGHVTTTGTNATNAAASATAAEAAKTAAEAAAIGFKVKAARVATTASITLSGAQTIDGVSAIAGDVVLVKDQSSASANGLYVVASGSWARSGDMDVWAEVVSAFVLVAEGATNADTAYLCTSNAGGTLGSTSIAFSKFLGAGLYAPLDSPTLTGDPKAPTPTAGDNDTSIATTAFVASAVDALYARNAQTGSSYTVLSGDRGKHLTFTNAAAVAVSLPQAGSTGFAGNYWFLAENVGPSPVTITPATSTVNGMTTFVLLTGEFAIITSDGTNWRAVIGNKRQQMRNLLCNVHAQVCQNGTGSAAAGAGVSRTNVDLWDMYKDGSGGFTVARDTDVPTVAQSGVAFDYSFKATVTTADTSLVSADNYVIFQAVEGRRCRGFTGKRLCLSIWVKEKKTGKKYFTLGAGTNKAIPLGYTINAADTWERKIIRIPATPSDLSITFGNGQGMSFSVHLAQGSGQYGTADTWGSNAVAVGSDIVNDMDSTSNYKMWVGAEIVEGDWPSNGQPASEGEELSECKRRLQFLGPELFGRATSSSAVELHADYEVEMRATPAVTLTTTTPTIVEMGVGGRTGSSSALSHTINTKKHGGTWPITGFSGLTSGNTMFGVDEGIIKLDARF